MNGVGVPWNGIGVPLNGVIVPWNGIGVPWNGIGVPFNGVVVPWNGIGVPWNGIGLPWNGVGVPWNQIWCTFTRFSTIRVSMSDRDERFFFPSERKDQRWNPPSLLLSQFRPLFPRVEEGCVTRRDRELSSL